MNLGRANVILSENYSSSNVNLTRENDILDKSKREYKPREFTTREFVF